MHRVWRAAVAACAISVTLLGVAAVGAHAEPADGPAVENVPGPSVVGVPFEGSIDVSPAAGWEFIDCAGLREAVPLVTACGADGFTAAAPEYDPEAEPYRVNVALRGPDGPTEIPYLVRLEPPAPPTGTDTTIDLPVPAGAPTLIPFTALGLDCERCTPGTASIEVAGVDPEASAAATVTGTHLVVVPHADTRGESYVHLRLVDDMQQVSKQFIVTLSVGNPDRISLRPLHRAVGPMNHDESRSDEGPLEFDVDQLVTQLDGTRSDIISVSCSLPLHGAALCSPEGRITYTPAVTAEGEWLRDQFSVRATDAEGREALASVTVMEASASLVPATGRDEMSVEVAVPFVDVEPSSVSGATAGFTTLMDALEAE